jgi:hypothetical protein
MPAALACNIADSDTQADLICVLFEGKIAEAGRHHELLARGGFYAEVRLDSPACARFLTARRSSCSSRRSRRRTRLVSN